MFRFSTVLLICILSGVEVDLFVPAFPELCKVFELDPFMVQLTLSVNFAAYCICSLFAGALGDRYNRRHIMLGSLLIFIIGSTLCVLAINFPLLIAGRFLQGAGIAGPAVIAYAVIADDYPIDKQITLIGILNGIVTIAMAFAPTIGSYINLYFDWRGNFFALLILGILCLVASYFVLPNRKGDPAISLSPKAYWPLLTSTPLLMFAACISCLVVPYWVFIGISPILYIDSLGVPLKHFGYYQGALAGMFAILSLSSSKILALIGQRRALYISIALCMLATILIFIVAIFSIKNPLIITCAMLFLTAGIIFPVNILFPLSITVVENTKARSTALIVSIRLVFTGICLQIVGFFYNGTFLLTGIMIAFFVVLSLLFMRKLFSEQWLKLSS